MLISKRQLTVTGLIGLLVLIWTVRLLPWDYHLAWVSTKETLSKLNPSSSSSVPSSGVLPHVEAYFDQAFSVGPPKKIPYPGIEDYCSHTEWKEDVYVDCIGMAAGMTSIISQVKVCLKMAIDSGSNLLLPAMPLRNSTDLLDFNFANPKEYYVYDEWFDVTHLREVMARNCPRMKILHPHELGVMVPVKHKDWQVLCKQASGYHDFRPLFWVGKPYGPFFNEELAKLQATDTPEMQQAQGVTIVQVDSKFLIYRITDDASGRDLRLWNDLANTIRFLDEPRKLTNELVDKLHAKAPNGYYGIHFRTENDTIWSGFDHQLQVDLDALDEAWKKFGKPDKPKPAVYLACGDEHQAERFVQAGAERGWEVLHKWKLLQDDVETMTRVNALAFDFQGAIDLGIMVRSQFFFGITGSAFSSTLSNLRDPTGRYRGSSFLLPDDAGARTHLFNDGNSDGYPCCL